MSKDFSKATLLQTLLFNSTVVPPPTLNVLYRDRLVLRVFSMVELLMSGMCSSVDIGTKTFATPMPARNASRAYILGERILIDVAIWTNEPLPVKRQTLHLLGCKKGVQGDQ